MIKMIFERLKERRKYEGYTQQEVANILNVQRATYAGWETGKDIMPEFCTSRCKKTSFFLINSRG